MIINLKNNVFRRKLLYKNSLFLIASNSFLSASGFLFWILIAHIYSTAQIGVATSLFSLVNLISSLSLLGITTGMMRYLPGSKDKSGVINSSLVFTVIVSTIVAFIFVLNIKIISLPLSFIRSNIFFLTSFIFFSVVGALNFLLESILVALRSSNLVFVKNILYGVSKFVFPFFLLVLGGYGIFTAIFLGILIGVAYQILALLIWHNVSYNIRLHFESIKTMATFSLGTYASGLATSLPSYLLPLLIINILGPSATAYYYIAATTANVLFMIPQVVTQNLLVEGSYNENEVPSHIKEAIKFTYAIIIPAILIMLLFGNYILLVFGKHYSNEGLSLLRLLGVSGLVVSINYILGTTLTIFKHIKLLIASNIIGSLVLLSASYFLLHIGLVGIGYATIISQLTLFILYILSLAKIKKLHFLKSVL